MDKRYIDANGVKRWLDACHLDSPYEVCYSEASIKKMIDCQPTEDVAEVRYGEWEIVKGSNGKEKMVCTNCRHQQDLHSTFTYCPNCGAKMDSKKQ